MSEAVFVHDAYKEFGNLYGPLSRLVHRLEANSGHGFYRGAEQPYTPVIVALDHISFSVEQGEIFGLLGSSGAGKSTLIRLLATQLVPDSGDLRVFDIDVIRQPDQVQRLINRVSGEASFFKKRSPVENLVYSARLYGTSRYKARQRAEQLLLSLGASYQDMNLPMDTLPQGMFQKVATARALLSGQRLLLLDEPTRSLNLREKRAVWAALRELRDNSGTTILVTTRDPEEAAQLCDRFAVLHQGKIIQDGEIINLEGTKYEYTNSVV